MAAHYGQAPRVWEPELFQVLAWAFSPHWKMESRWQCHSASQDGEKTIEQKTLCRRLIKGWLRGDYFITKEFSYKNQTALFQKALRAMKKE